MARNNSITVKVQNLGKIYKLYNDSTDRLKEALNPFGKKYFNEFYALKNVSFELYKGQSLGIIGRNGSGKSTLLKLIAGVLTPSTGQVNTKGKIAAILELTSSMKPELTGLENIQFNLKLNRISKDMYLAKVNEVQEFAELGEFINQPVKNYSSGMKSRLGFAIAVSIEPDILILDEVLAVGDFVFQQKCLSKINSMRINMTTIFVSHSMNSVRQFCDRAIVVDKGSIIFDGETDFAIEYYLESEHSKNTIQKNQENKITKPFYGELFHNSVKITQVFHKWNRERYKLDNEMVLDFSFSLKYKPKNLIIGIPVWDEMGNLITAFNSDYNKNTVYCGNNLVKGNMKTNCYFNPGNYLSVFVVVDGAEYLYRQVIDSFSVANKERVFGWVSLPHQWDVN